MTVDRFSSCFRHPLFLGITIILLTVIVFRPALDNDTIWDDKEYVERGASFQAKGIEGLKAIWFDVKANPQYYPLLYSSFVLDAYIWGEDHFFPHLINVILHALVAILLWRVLVKLRVPWAFAIGLLFALHPVHVESVAWLAERKNLLSGMFYLASMWVFLHWHAKRFADEAVCQFNAVYLASFILFVAALACKTVTATLPFVVLLILWWKQSLNRESAIRLAPFILIGIGAGLLTAWLEQRHAGAIGPAWDFSWIDRCLIAGRAVWFYIGKLLVPYDLTFIYPRWTIDSGDITQYVYPLMGCAVTIGLWFAITKVGRGPLAAVLIFSGTLFPALGFLNYYPMQFSFVADHFQYLASAAMITLVITTIHRYLGRFDHRLLSVGLVAVLCVYALISQDLQKQYKNEYTLWLATIDKNPEAWLAHGNLGAIYMNRNQYPEAVKHLKRSVEINPGNIIAYNNLAQLYFNLAHMEQGADNLEKALVFGKRALQLGREEREFLELRNIKMRTALDHMISHRVVGDIKKFQRDRVAARQQYEAILAMSPGNTDALNRMGAWFLEVNQHVDALKYFRKSKAVDPEQFDADYNIGLVMFYQEKHAQAVEYFNQALAKGEAEQFVRPHYYLGLIKKMAGDDGAAREHFQIVANKLTGTTLGRKALEELVKLNLRSSD